MDVNTVLVIIGIALPAIVAIIKSVQKSKGDKLINTIVDGVNAASETLDDREIDFIKSGIQKVAVSRGLEPILNKIVKSRK